MNYEYTWPDKHDIQYFLTPLQNYLKEELGVLYGQDEFSFVRDLVSGKTMALIGLDRYYADLTFGWPGDQSESIDKIPATVISEAYVVVELGYSSVINGAIIGLSYFILDLTPEQLLILRSLA